MSPPEASADAAFGVELDVEGSVLVAATMWDEHDGVPGYGSVYAFRLGPAGTWVQAQQIVASSSGSGANFGWAVDMDGTHMFVGTRYFSSEGEVTVLERQPDDTWVQIQLIEEPVPSDTIGFGYSVAIDGDFALIGAPDDDEGANNSGAAYVYERQPSGTWVHVAKLVADQPQTHEHLGRTVSLDGDRAIVAAPTWDFPGESLFSQSGRVFLFERDASGAWNRVAEFRAFESKSVFGRSVSLSGSTAVVGASSVGDADGAAYVFEREEPGGWAFSQELVPHDAPAGNSLGRKVALAGDACVVAAPNDDTIGSSAGAVYLFRRTEAGPWVEVRKIFDTSGAPIDSFGGGVTIDDHWMAVGAPGHGGSGQDQGAVFPIPIGSGPITTASLDAISLSLGEQQNLSLEAGLSHAGDLYLLLGSASGISPGFSLGDGRALPLNQDAYFDHTLLNASLPPLVQSLGVVDGAGKASAGFYLPPGTDPSLVGLVGHHAFVLLDPATLAVTGLGDAVPVRLDP